MRDRKLNLEGAFEVVVAVRVVGRGTDGAAAALAAWDRAPTSLEELALLLDLGRADEDSSCAKVLADLEVEMDLGAVYSLAAERGCCRDCACAEAWCLAGVSGLSDCQE